MTRLQRILLVIVVVELVAGGGVLLRQRNQTVPPLPAVDLFDPLTARQLRQARDAVRPDSAPEWSDLAELYLAHGFYPEAEACWRQACEISPADAELRGQWAFCLSRMGRMEEAVDEFQRAIADGHPDPAELRYFTACDWLRLEQTAAARQTFEQAAELPAAQYELAKLDLRDGLPAKAVARLEELQAEFPDCFPPHWLRARAEALLGNRVQAEQYRRLAASTTRRLPTPFDEKSQRVTKVYHEFGRQRELEQVRQWIDRGRIDSARKLVTELLEQQWTAEAADLLADVEYAEGNLAESRRVQREVLDREGPSLHWLWRYGDACEAAGHLDEAVDAWTRAVELGPEKEARGLYVKLSQFHEASGDADAARRMKARFYYASGVDLLDRGRTEEARQSLRESLAADTDNAQAWFYLGQCLEQQGMMAEARQAYGHCRQLQAFHGRALDALERLRVVSPGPQPATR